MSHPFIILNELMSWKKDTRQPSTWGINYRKLNNEGRRRMIMSIANIRGGGVDNVIQREKDENDTTSDVSTTSSSNSKEEVSLEDRVEAAMRKLGLNPPSESTSYQNNDTEVLDSTTPTANSSNENLECEGGICEIKSPSTTGLTSKESFDDMKSRLVEEMGVNESIVHAALGATLIAGDGALESRLDEEAARSMIANERDAIERILEDCEEVEQLVSEGHDKTLSRRALAFADMNIEVARAILIADEDDANAEEEEYQRKLAESEEEKKRAKLRDEVSEERKKQEVEMKSVKVDADFDPTQSSFGTVAPKKPEGAPKPAKKEDVIFEATSENIQKLVLESPVPVLLDVYADWCGPCKALAPALEQMAIKAGGMFRLVKLNTDEERTISSALEVQSLPTVFGFKDGKILHHFKGMPRDEDFMRNFMMGLLGAGDFNPKVTSEEKAKYEELTLKFMKIAGSSGFSFSQRERLQVWTNDKLDELVDVCGNMADAEKSATIIRTLLSNIIRDPFEERFRRVNLENKIISSQVASFPPAIAILKSVGFSSDNENHQKVLIMGKGKKFINVTPHLVARDTIDKWIDINRRAIAADARKKEDEKARARLINDAEEEESEVEDEEEYIVMDSNTCNLKLRIEGKKKIHDLTMSANDTLNNIVDNLPIDIPKGEQVRIICTARRLDVKNSDEISMGKSLRESKLMPAASIVVKIGSDRAKEFDKTSKSSLKERAAARKSKSKTNTMQSTGIYSKDDNAKGELIDGGGGVWYEHDVSDDEPEESPASNEVAEDED